MAESEWKVIVPPPVQDTSPDGWSVIVPPPAEDDEAPLYTYPLAGIESVGRMGAGMVGTTAGALVGGAEALASKFIEGRDEPAADIIRRRMAAGAEQMTPSGTLFRKTPAMDKMVGEGFEHLREGIGRGSEALETARGTVAEALTPESMHPYVGAKPEAARTLGEYAFDAAAVAAPLTMARGALVRRRLAREQAAAKDNLPQTEEPGVPKTPQEIADRAWEERDTAEQARQNDTSVAYEIKEREGQAADMEQLTSDADALRQAIKDFQERGAAGEGPITETERTSSALRQFQERGAAPDASKVPLSERGSVGEVKRHSRLQSELEELTTLREEARRREEKDTVRFYDQEIAGIKDQIADIEATQDVPIKPGTGPGKRQMGAVFYWHDVAPPIRAAINTAFQFIKSRWPRFSENMNIDVQPVEKFIKNAVEAGLTYKEVSAEGVDGYMHPTKGKIIISDRLGSRPIEYIVDYLAHELRHGFDLPRKPYLQNHKLAPYWSVPGKSEAMRFGRTLSREDWASIPAEKKAIAAGDAASLRYITGGPGKRQRGFIGFGGKKKPRERTAFEIEENVVAGGGAALRDVRAPLEQRAQETLARGIELTQNQFEHLSTDINSFFTKYGPTTEHLSKLVAESAPVLKATIDKIKAIKEHWAGARTAAMHGSEWMPFHIRDLLNPYAWFATRLTRKQGAGFMGIFERMKPDDQKSMLKARLEFDNAPVLAEQGLQWPTREMLREKGYNDVVIEGYMREADYMEMAYSLINKVRAAAGLKPIAKIPGYFPHTYRGHLGIKVVRLVKDAATGVVERVPVGFMKVSASRSKAVKMAREAIAEIQKEMPEAKLDYDPITRTDKPGNFMDQIDALETASQIYAHADKPLTQLVRKVLNNRVASMEQAFLQASLKRHGLKGWIGSTGVTTKNVKEIWQARNNYLENVFKYAESEQIRMDIMESLSPQTANELANRLPNTYSAMKQLVDVARESVQLNEADHVIAKAFSWATGDRYTYRAPIIGVSKLRSLFAMKDLSWSFRYHIGNFFQPEVIGWPALVREHARMGGAGSLLKAMAFTEYNFINPTREHVAAIKWAAENRVVAPKLMEEIDFLRQSTGRPKLDNTIRLAAGRRASEANEGMGRLRTFLMGREYYKSAGFTEAQARIAASKFVSDVMVDYDQAGIPLWLSNNPFGQTAGKVVAPYAAFRHSFWGQTALAIQAIKQAPHMRHKLLPLLAMQGSLAFYAGLRGIVFMAEAELFVQAANNWWEWQFNEPGPLTSPTKFLIQKGLGDAAVFGALSAATKQLPDSMNLKHGVDIGATIAAPRTEEVITPRAIEGAWDTAVAGKNAIKMLFGNAADSEKVQFFKAMTPNFVHGMIEAAYANDEGVSLDENNRMRGNVTRDKYDWEARKWYGTRSLKEQRELMTKREIIRGELRGRERKADLTELAADEMQRDGIIREETIAQAIEEGYSSRQFRERVNELVAQRGQSRLQSMAGTKGRTRTRERIRAELEEMLPDYDY